MMVSDIMVPMPDDQIGRMALIEAVRAQTDAVSRLVRAEEARDGKLEAIKDQLGDMRTNIALLQKDSPRAELTALTVRVTALEAAQERVKGERGLVTAVFNSKGLAWLVASAAVVGAWAKGVFQ